MRRIERLFVALNGAVVVAILTTMAFVVGTNVLLRYTTNQSLPWADELARYAMIWMTFLGAGLALRQGGHVAITNLHDLLNTRAQRILRTLLVIALLGFFAFMVSVGLEYMDRAKFQKTPAMRISYLYIYAAMPIGFCLLVVHLLLIAKGFILAGSYRAAPDQKENTVGAARG